MSIERYFALYGVLHGLDYVIARLANPYGAWQSPFKGQGLIATILYKAFKKEELEIWGDGHTVRDYIYIADAIQGVLSVGFKGKIGEIYNIGTGQGQSINQLIDTAEIVLSVPIAVQYVSHRTIDVKRNVLCSDKLFNCTGWQPTVQFSEGLRLFFVWMREQYGF